MSLICGPKSNASCPVCLIHRDSLNDMAQEDQLCIQDEMQAAVKATQQLCGKDAAGILQPLGLQEVHVHFSIVLQTSCQCCFLECILELAKFGSLLCAIMGLVACILNWVIWSPFAW